jgi:hypothetical protein
MKITMPNIKAKTPGYPHGLSNSGMYLKFIPYTPTKNVSGKKKAENTVSTFITSLVFWEETDKYTVRRLFTSSVN